MTEETTNKMIADIEANLLAIDPRLLLFTTRSGQKVFYVYDSLGCPTTTERLFVLRRGDGRPKELDNCALPSGQWVFGTQGWGMCGVTVLYQASSESVIALAEAAAHRLVAAIQLAQSPRTLRVRLSEQYWHVRQKVAAFCAA